MLKLAYYIRSRELHRDPRLQGLLAALRGGGARVYELREDASPEEGTDILLSFGGDGTFLSAAQKVIGTPIPVLGVNLGRLGFLSETRLDALAPALLQGAYRVERRALLEVDTGVKSYALNEMALNRTGAAMLGIDVLIDGAPLPTYWADGLLVATSSGSTAYSLSVGGPICTPAAEVLIVAPIAPHNLNVRPLVLPASAQLEIRLRSRDGGVMCTVDNRAAEIPADSCIRVSTAPLTLGKVSVGDTSFIDALRDRLLWGQDVRNVTEKNTTI